MRRITFPPVWGIFDRAEADRAGVGHGEPGTAGAEMIQMRLDDALADRHPLPAVPRAVPASALSHRDPLPSLSSQAVLVTPGSPGHPSQSWSSQADPLPPGYVLLVWKIGQPISVRQADSSGVS